MVIYNCSHRKLIQDPKEYLFSVNQGNSIAVGEPQIKIPLYLKKFYNKLPEIALEVTGCPQNTIGKVQC